MTPEEREIRKLRKHLADLTNAAMACVRGLDAAMEQPDSSGLGQGERIARLANDLEMAGDRARHFGLGINLRTGEEEKR